MFHLETESLLTPWSSSCSFARFQISSINSPCCNPESTSTVTAISLPLNNLTRQKYLIGEFIKLKGVEGLMLHAPLLMLKVYANTG